MGRCVFGVAALMFGIAGLVWQQQLQSGWRLPGAAVFNDVASLAQIAGGIAILFPRTARVGALVLGIVYFVFALTWAARIPSQPFVYGRWGDVFERLAFVAGAMVVYGIRRPAVILLGICTISFMLGQAFLMSQTASLVPKWIPPGQMFWAVATTVAFGLAGISLMSGYKVLPASRLLTLMLLIFAVAVWIPIVIAAPGTHFYWAELLETIAIAGAAWIVADHAASSSPDGSMAIRGS